MDGRGKIRVGFILVTISTFLLIFTTSLSISGYSHSQMIINDDDDFTSEDERIVALSYISDGLEVLMISVYSDSPVDYILKVEDDTADEIFRERGTTDDIKNVPILDAGKYSISIEITDSGHDVDDIDIEVRTSGLVLAGICLSSTCLLFIFPILLITGTLLTLRGYTRLRARQRGGRG